MKSKQKRVLGDHKKVGSTFVTPMNQLPNMRSRSYVNDMLPELIWYGLLNDRWGYVEGTRLFERVVRAAHEQCEESGRTNFAYSSCYLRLTETQKSKVREMLEEEGKLSVLRNSLGPLTLLYDGFPLGFLGPPDELRTPEKLVNTISACVQRHLNKYETPAIVLHGAAMVASMVCDKLRFSADMKLPDFNQVIENPESDEAQRAAGFMRASALGTFGMVELSDDWARYFWNRGLELSPCTYLEGVEP